MSKPNGYTLYSDSKVVVIATGVNAANTSANRKTGAMVQIWIIRHDIDPVTAVKTGADESICGNCIHRGDMASGRKRSCYVNVGQAPLAVYRAYHRGNYPLLALAQYADVFSGRAVRLGAYGDPVHIPQHIIAAICSHAAKHTGYTHQWRTNEWLKPFVMASCDTPADYHNARSKGWRTFRVSIGLTPEAGEILCPSSAEAGNKTNCAKCGLCNGAGFAKNIYIPVHGTGKKNALTVIQ